MEAAASALAQCGPGVGVLRGAGVGPGWRGWLGHPNPETSPEFGGSAPAPSEIPHGKRRRKLPVPRPWMAAPLFPQSGGIGDSRPQGAADVRSGTPETGEAIAATSGVT